jgi:hypothetical protein
MLADRAGGVERQAKTSPLLFKRFAGLLAYVA